MRSITAPAATSLQPVFPAIERALKRIPGFAQASQQVANAIHSAVLNGGDGARQAADLLHGTRLGHPLHPALVHLPIGAWAMSALFDGASLLTRSRQAGHTADALIAIGAALAVPVALTGAADYSALQEDAIPQAALHATLNEAALVLYLLSLGSRRDGRRGRGLLLSTIALGVVTLSASIGGDLVYRKRAGVSHTQVADGLDEWTDVLAESELAPGRPMRVTVGGAGVMLYRDDDAIHAIGADCQHAGGPLEEGKISGHCVECPWHQSVFDMRDGSVVHGPATQPQPRYLARRRGGRIELRKIDGRDSAAPVPQEREVGGFLP